MALSHPRLSPGLSESPDVAAQEGCDLGRGAFHYWQQWLPEGGPGSRPLRLPHCDAACSGPVWSRVQGQPLEGSDLKLSGLKQPARCLAQADN